MPRSSSLRRCFSTSGRGGAPAVGRGGTRPRKRLQPTKRHHPASRPESAPPDVMELTPVIPSGRQVIESYGPGGFRVAGVVYPRPILVFRDATLDWQVAGIESVSAETLRPVIERGGTEILLLGCGTRMARVSLDLPQALKKAGIALEAMDTGAACRTYNVLLSEDRRVAAALLLPA